MLDQYRADNGGNGHNQKAPPALYAEVVLALDNKWVKYADNKKCCHSNHQPREVVLLQKLNHIS